MARSQSVVGFWLVDFLRRPGMLAEPLAELFELTAAGELRPVVGGQYGLSEAATAHRALRSRSTVGKLLLDPSR
jgi:NADPH2:quinone reductase